MALAVRGRAARPRASESGEGRKGRRPEPRQSKFPRKDDGASSLGVSERYGSAPWCTPVSPVSGWVFFFVFLFFLCAFGCPISCRCCAPCVTSEQPTDGECNEDEQGKKGKKRERRREREKNQLIGMEE